MTKKEQRPIVLKRGKRGRASKTEKGLRERQQEKRRKLIREGKKRGRIGKGNRRRKGICRARVIPSKTSTRRKRLQRKERNSKKAHNGSLGNSTRWRGGQ